MKETHALFPLVSDRPAFAPRACHVPESIECGAPRLAFAEAAGHQLALAHRQMEVEFIVDFVVDVRPAQPQRKTIPEIHQPLDGEQDL